MAKVMSNSARTQLPLGSGSACTVQSERWGGGVGGEVSHLSLNPTLEAGPAASQAPAGGICLIET